MSSFVSLDVSDDSLFEQKSFDPIPAGKYEFEIAKELRITVAQSGNKIINVELRCVDDKEDGRYKGRVVFDTIVLTKKAMWKLTSLAMAAGMTEEEIKANGGVDLDQLQGCVVKARVDIEPERLLPDGRKVGPKNVVKQYIY